MYEQPVSSPAPQAPTQPSVATAPQIGNTGWNREDGESRDEKIWVAGYVVRDPSRVSSNWRATSDLVDALAGQGVVGISGVDTRASGVARTE